MKHRFTVHWDNNRLSLPFDLEDGWKKKLFFGSVSGEFSLTRHGEIWEAGFTVAAGEFRGWLSLEFTEENWSPENYLLMPAAVYGGNRVHIFTERHLPLLPPDQKELAPPQMTGIVHHLSPCGGGRIDLMAGEYAFPAMGCFFREEKRSFWILTHPGNELGDHGYSVKEGEKGKSLSLEITTPCYRKFCQRGYKLVPADDHTAFFSAGMRVGIKFAEIHGECPSLKAFFRQAFSLRNRLVIPGRAPDLYPLSRGAELLRERMEKANYREEYGYYSTITLDYLEKNPHYKSHYVLAWVGGSMKLENLFLEGSPLAEKHSMRELKTLFSKAQQNSGFLFTVCCDGTFMAEWYPNDDCIRTSCLVRKNAEGFASLMRQISQYRKRKKEVPSFWYEGMKKWAEAFQKLWKRYKQFGYLLDPVTGEITIGGGAGGIGACTGLAMASEFFKEPQFLETAREAVLHYAANDLAKGVIYGGVGDAFQAADSESAYMLLEALVTVWEYTGEPELLEEALFAADHLATWCVAYDYGFPPSSTYGKLKMGTTGTVYANIQNRHSSPGFCSASGDALFKLYRATDREEYLLLLQEIIRALPQYVARKDRPIHGLDNDRMNERINMADWEGKERIGELFNASCWPEVSLLLARIHIPGIYVRKDLEKAFSFDHIQAEIRGKKLTLCNTTFHDAEVTVLAEDKEEMKVALKAFAYSFFRKVHVPAGGMVQLEI